MTQTTEPRRQVIPSQAAMREAVATRDAGLDGCFVYGVVTTGVFCRPSCPSRAARAENLRFFATADDAERAGFRACRRCAPGEVDVALNALIAVARFIESHAAETLPLKALAARTPWSAAVLRRRFRQAFGVSPRQFQQAARLGRLKQALRAGTGVAAAIYDAGYGSASRVYEGGARHLGMTPARYRAGGHGERIDFAYRDAALGPLMLAATDRGVCFVQFGASREALLEQLHREFPAADIHASPAASAPELDRWLAALDRHLGQNGPRPDLPLDLRGTAFQLLVWRFLLGIDTGDVVSYKELASGIGRPRAVRAAATACAANKVAVLVPCHRVLRGDGGLGGYRWGEARKRTLLDNERHQHRRRR